MSLNGNIDKTIGWGAALLGVVAFFIPGVDKLLAATLALTAFFVFSELRLPEQGKGEFSGVMQLLRYICVVWVVIVGLQQLSKSAFVQSAEIVAGETILDIRDQRAAGRLINIQVEQIDRTSQLNSANSYMVQATDSKLATAVPTNEVVSRAVKTLAKPVEGTLYFVGAVLAVFAILLHGSAFVSRSVSKTG